MRRSLPALVSAALLLQAAPAGAQGLVDPSAPAEHDTEPVVLTGKGFSVYSGEDQHTTYAYDREGFRFTRDGPKNDPCRAQQATPTAKDPVKGLDANDEVVFMASDAGTQAPTTAAAPKGITELKQVE